MLEQRLATKLEELQLELQGECDLSATTCLQPHVILHDLSHLPGSDGPRQDLKPSCSKLWPPPAPRESVFRASRSVERTEQERIDLGRTTGRRGGGERTGERTRRREGEDPPEKQGDE